MSSVLVVGATGQLGSAVVARLDGDGRRPRALVRAGSSFGHLEAAEVELAFGDLRDRASLREAVRGVEAVIATASVVFPRGRASFAADEGAGYENLIGACEEEGVEQIVFVSNHAPYIDPYLERVPSLKFKLAIEQALEDSAVHHTILRSAPFMDDYFALIGSDIPLRGAQSATLRRPFWFSRQYVRWTAGMIERWGVASVPGKLNARNAFIALEDVAAFLVAALGREDAFDSRLVIGGPENLSWQEVADLYARLLGRRVRAIPSSPGMSRAGSALLSRLSPAAANQMGLLWVLGENENVVDDAAAVAGRFGVELTGAESFLRGKIALGPGAAASLRPVAA